VGEAGAAAAAAAESQRDLDSAVLPEPGAVAAPPLHPRPNPHCWAIPANGCTSDGACSLDVGGPSVGRIGWQALSPSLPHLADLGSLGAVPLNSLSQTEMRTTQQDLTGQVCCMDLFVQGCGILVPGDTKKTP
jgi:hypothetical protein